MSKNDASEPQSPETSFSDEELEAMVAALKPIASRKLRRERAGISLQTTDLVDEALARLLSPQWRREAAKDPRRFFARACLAMERALVDRARRRLRARRGGGARRVPLDDVLELLSVEPETLAELGDLFPALERACGERVAMVARLRILLGVSVKDIPTLVGVSEGTVARDWRLARAWLEAELGRTDAGA